jgi:hypothetical protein
MLPRLDGFFNVFIMSIIMFNIRKSSSFTVAKVSANQIRPIGDGAIPHPRAFEPAVLWAAAFDAEKKLAGSP